MEKDKKDLAKKLLLIPLVVAGSLVIAPRQNTIKEITGTYQGYNEDDGNAYLVFDDKPKNQREGFPELVIKGRPDTLKIGEDYTVRYSIKNGRNQFPKKIIDIKYAK